jgi:hypothetical protein
MMKGRGCRDNAMTSYALQSQRPDFDEVRSWLRLYDACYRGTPLSPEGFGPIV